MTPAQYAVWSIVRDFNEAHEHKANIAYRKIAQMRGIGTVGSIFAIVQELVRKGHLRRVQGSSPRRFRLEIIDDDISVSLGGRLSATVRTAAAQRGISAETLVREIVRERFDAGGCFAKHFADVAAGATA